MKWKPGFQIVDISPATAQAFLANNPDNRNVSQIVVDKYAAEIRAGRWVVNGVPIIVTTKHRLLDGQRRLMAVVKSGETIRSAVYVADADASDVREIFATIDIGKKRNLSDTLAIRGMQNTTTVSSAGAMLDSYIHDRMIGGSARVPQGQLLDVIEEHPRLAVSAAMANGDLKTLQSLIPPSVICFTHYLFGEIAPKERDGFFVKFASGAGLPAGDPVLLLRNTLQRERSRRGSKSSLNRVWSVAIVIKGWNAFVVDGAASLLRWSSSTENFPRAIRKNGRVFEFSTGNGASERIQAEAVA